MPPLSATSLKKQRRQYFTGELKRATQEQAGGSSLRLRAPQGAGQFETCDATFSRARGRKRASPDGAATAATACSRMLHGAAKRAAQGSQRSNQRRRRQVRQESNRSPPCQRGRRLRRSGAQWPPSRPKSRCMCTEGSKGGLRAYREPPGRYGTAPGPGPWEAGGGRSGCAAWQTKRRRGSIATRFAAARCHPATCRQPAARRARKQALPVGSPTQWRTDVGIWVQVLPQPRFALLQRAVNLNGVVLQGTRTGRKTRRGIAERSNDKNEEGFCLKKKEKPAGQMAHQQLQEQQQQAAMSQSD